MPKRTEGKRLTKIPGINCVECGKFISYSDKKATVYFEPDSDRGAEVVEWTCGECVEAGRTALKTGAEE